MAPTVEHDPTLWRTIDPTRIEASMRQPLDADVARDWHLVLTAQGIDSRLQPLLGGWQLAVPAPELEKAVHELQLFTAENRDWPPLPPTATGFDNAWFNACLLAALALFHNITRLPNTPFSLRTEDWLHAGNAHVAAIRSGQWWRLATALTLHSGPLHLASNILIGGIFVIRLCRELGSGVGWFLLLLVGMAGNFLNSLIQPGYHQSVGASTAIFGAIGVLAALNARRHRLRLTRKWTLPLAAGLALLALLGTGERRTDLLAHLFGFLCGLLSGWFIAPLPQAGPRLNRWLGLLAALIIVLAWLLALQTIR
ncbi:rhomboid-related membrane protein [Syntrophotalea carbinolica DSM 2380]|uniref:Rhomboid-related membrane protein n=1 Tax=Syntrophotalea carbinolica (strain DSM 2380 / NBRC 103641 / GraBd1) TaxID=338963 RepID=Q3A1R5_SYNC1|nr:rhomboid family intramembrane serine protease [Syntrophotalea carbinolica]ABA89692.1 rhomboid-related membrane protein [Syntrophotalea carbinolica DSM 2380]